MQERLQKIISRAGLASRRRAEELIREGRVAVNGVTALLGQTADADTDCIEVDGAPLSIREQRTYIMLNKPRGYVTTLADEKGRRDVSMLVRDAGVRLYPVGRLDMYSEGLLLMTDDGEAANRLMHPSHDVNKTYRAWVTGENIPLSIDKMGRSMDIDGYSIRPADIEILGTEGEQTVLAVTIHEGRNRQIRKMCEKCSLRLHRLQRISEGRLLLGELPCGSWRKLTDEEIRYLQEL
ncbi:MAG: pseudouridine synthase [Candidatus Heteroscillospira sp.]|jgi:23S rRNA pseudouridine2605 synthase